MKKFIIKRVTSSIIRKNILFFLIFLNISYLYSDTVQNRSVIFDQEVVSEKQGIIFKSKTWIKNNKTRMEYMEKGKSMISIITDNLIHNFDPEEKRGAVLPIQKKKNVIGSEILQSEKELREFLDLMQAEVIDQEEIDDKLCDIYEYTDIERDVIHNIWIWRKHFFPLRVTMDILNNNDTISIYYTNVTINASMKDNLFEVPSDIKLQRY